MGARRSAMGERPGQPQDLIGAAVFLSSDDREQAFHHWPNDPRRWGRSMLQTLGSPRREKNQPDARVTLRARK